MEENVKVQFVGQGSDQDARTLTVTEAEAVRLEAEGYRRVKTEKTTTISTKKKEVGDNG